MANVGSPLFDSMISQKLLHKNIFAFYMSMDKKDKSELTFGSIDTNKFIGDIEYHPVID